VLKDFADFLAALNREGVAYVVIGGFAVLRYVPYRTTRDIVSSCPRRSRNEAMRVSPAQAAHDRRFHLDFAR
jgi:hypothetical protein